MSRRFDPSLLYFLIGAFAAAYGVWILVGNDAVGPGIGSELAQPVAASPAD
jgi:hypothetical protein